MLACGKGRRWDYKCPQQAVIEYIYIIIAVSIDNAVVVV
jgi:hypothetical protein